MDGGAVISDCGLFRYKLWRAWGPGRRLIFVMLNPSTGDADKNDATIRKCCQFAKDADFDGIEIYNLFAYRTAYPSELRLAGYAVGPDNDNWLSFAAAGATSPICLAWGAHGRRVPERVGQVIELLSEQGATFCTLYKLNDGEPAHPLMLPYSCTLQEFKYG
jgi:hypothetical protein